MGVIIKAGFGKPTIQFERVEISGFYLRRAYRSAKWLMENPNPEDLDDQLEHSMLEVQWSVLALEAAANSIGEDVIPGPDYALFERCRKKFEKPPKVSALVWKWHWLFKLGANKDVGIDADIFAGVEELVQLRHRLTHYSPQEAARKIYFDPPQPTTTPEGRRIIMMWNADAVPSKVEPSLVEKAFLSGAKPGHYMTARKLLLEWHLANGGDGANLTDNFPVIS